MERRPTPVCKCFVLCRQIFVDPVRQDYSVVSLVHQVFSTRYPLVATATVPHAWSATHVLTLGSGGGSAYFPGSIGNVQLYQRALSR